MGTGSEHDEAATSNAEGALRGLDETLELRAALTALDDAAAKVVNFEFKGRPEIKKFRERVKDMLKHLSEDLEDDITPPPGMVHKENITELMKERQRTYPPKWSMKLQQWETVIDHCIDTPQYKQVKDENKFVTMYDINNTFVKPWTSSTGCGLAVSMSLEEPDDATLMLSHAWAEDVEETKQAVQSFIEKHELKREEVRLWFCVFANYQCGDREGPSIEEQLALDPFAKVIECQALKSEAGGQGMLAVHTTRADLYSRLWCVYEVASAKKEPGVEVCAAFSEKYVKQALDCMKVYINAGFDGATCKRAASITCSTASATCSREEDRQTIIAKVSSEYIEEGGFHALDKLIETFREENLPPEAKHLALTADIESLHTDKETVAEAVQNWEGKREDLITLLAQRLGKDKRRQEARFEAVIALASVAERGDEAAKAALLERLKADERLEVRSAAAKALVSVAERGDEAVKAALIERLEGDDAVHVRCSAAAALVSVAERGDEAAKTALLERLEGDDAEYVRRSAAEALGSVAQRGDEAAKTALLERLEADDACDVRRFAANALKSVAERGDEAAKTALLERLTADKSWQVRHGAAQALGSVVERGDEAAKTALLERLEADKDTPVRHGAAQALVSVADRGDEAVKAALLERLEVDSEIGVRCEAAKALASVAERGDEAAKTALLERLKADENYKVRQDLAKALVAVAKRGDEASKAALIESLKADENEYVRAAAAGALCEVASKGSEDVMAILTTSRQEDGSELVRLEAMVSMVKLSDTGHTEAVKSLTNLIGHEEWTLRQAAAKALSVVAAKGDEVAMAALVKAAGQDEDGDVRAAAATALGEVAPEAHEASMAALANAMAGDTERNVRRAAEEALAKVQPPEVATKGEGEK